MIELYKVIKGEPISPPATNEGSHYYAFSPRLNMNNYLEAYARITLPTDIVWSAEGHTRNAFIALGIASQGEGYGCDMGLANFGGGGWKLCFGGLAVGNTVIVKGQPLPIETKTLTMIVKNDKTRDTKMQSCMSIYVECFDSKSKSLGFQEVSTFVTKRNWDCYYRFASLLYVGNNSFTDGTRMMGTKFENLMLYNNSAKKYEPWGMETDLTNSVWIVGFPNGCLWPYDANSETFNINNLPDKVEVPTEPPVSTPSEPVNYDIYNILFNQMTGLTAIIDKKELADNLQKLSEYFKR